MAAMGQSQAEATKEAQRAGVGHAKAIGAKNGGKAYKGRKPSFTREKFDAVVSLLDGGSTPIATIAKDTGLTRQTVYRVRDERAEMEKALAMWAE